MPEKTPLICCIILNWNSFDVVADCLDSLKNTNYASLKTIIVDNGSRDDSIKKIKLIDNEIDTILLSENVGFAMGNNIGVDYALKKYSPEYILLLNNDTIVHKELITYLLKSINYSKRTAVVVPKIYYFSNPQILWYAGGYFNILSGFGEHYGINKIDSERYSQTREITFMNGCAALIKASVLEKVGLFPPEYFLMCEDTDFSLRLKGNGYSIVFEPNAKIWHKIGHSTLKNKGEWFRLYHVTRNTLNLIFNYIPFYIRPLTILYFSVRWVVYMSLKLSLSMEFNGIKNIFFGITDSLKNRNRYFTINKNNFYTFNNKKFNS